MLHESANNEGSKIIALNVFSDKLFHLIFKSFLASFTEMQTNDEGRIAASHDQSGDLRRGCRGLRDFLLNL